MMSLLCYIEGLNLSGIDFSDHHSLTKDIVSLNVAFMTLVVFVTGIRLSIRLCMIQAAGLDDCTSASYPFPPWPTPLTVISPLSSYLTAKLSNA